MKTIRLLISVLISPFLFSQAGTLDSTFGSNGVVMTSVSPSGSDGNKIIVKDDDSFIVVGSFLNEEFGNETCLVSYLSNGQIHPQFGLSGIVKFNLFEYPLLIENAALQSDGSIIVVGTLLSMPSPSAVVLRLNEDGSFDQSFGTNGSYIYTNPDGETTCKALCVLPNDDIVLVATTALKMAFIKINSNGLLVDSFGTNGIKEIEVYSVEEVKDVKLRSNGKLVALASVIGVDPDYYDLHDFALVQVNADGSIDTSFGVNGKVVSAFVDVGEDYPYQLNIQSDDKLLISGSCFVDTNSDMAIQRLLSNGTVDISFGDNGTVVQEMSNSDEVAYGALIQENGNIIIGGSSYVGSGGYTSFFTRRYNSDGSVDTTYGLNGQTLSNFTNNYSADGKGIAFQGTNKFLMTGSSQSAEQSLMTTARYNLETLGVEDMEGASQELQISPNPVKDRLYIHSKQGNSIFSEAKIYSVEGQLLKSVTEEAFGNQNSIDVSELPAGMYLIQVTYNNESQTLKFIKQ